MVAVVVVVDDVRGTAQRSKGDHEHQCIDAVDFSHPLIPHATTYSVHARHGVPLAGLAGLADARQPAA